MQRFNPIHIFSAYRYTVNMNDTVVLLSLVLTLMTGNLCNRSAAI